MTLTGTAGTFLTKWLLGRAAYFATLLGLMGTLTCIGQNLANVLVNRVIVRLNPENVIGKAYFLAGVTTLDILDR